MPYIDIFELFLLCVGVASTGLFWWKRNIWTKASVSVIAFIAAAYAFRFAGIHKCDEGSPPEILAFAVGGLAASLPWMLAQWRLAVPLAFVVVFFAGTFTARALAHSYHAPEVTGNPAFSSGRFWHSSVTGQLPRDPKKVAEFWSRIKSDR
jgi:hypothetical protein